MAVVSFRNIFLFDFNVFKGMHLLSWTIGKIGLNGAKFKLQLPCEFSFISSWVVLQSLDGMSLLVIINQFSSPLVNLLSHLRKLALNKIDKYQLQLINYPNDVITWYVFKGMRT